MNPTSFKAQSETSDGVHVIAVHGELDLNTAPELEQPLDAALEADDGPLVIDLGHCEFIDSTGIALLVRAWRQLGSNGKSEDRGRFAICCVNDQVQRLLDITGLESSIPTHHTRGEALSEVRG